ncbi:MAG: 2-amino-4-hydroxy-6-hydroxymethyldihydropteridine diphosphokinase [Comamonadaceae bacterium]|nr:MAG: 2-amino-4-hydroxy-6-hydroxymethyldihydropteridine diphosphokinase [Comamonadaceae bacterium]
MLERSPVVATVGLGANLGNPQAALAGAMASIAALEGVRLVAQSALYRSAPIDSSGPDYVNAVVQLQTNLSAPELLAELQTIELGAGRERPYRNAPRTLDLDILLFGDASIQSPSLTVPHPRMWQRAFVLLPLAEIAPALVSTALLDSVKDQALVRLVP